MNMMSNIMNMTNIVLNMTNLTNVFTNITISMNMTESLNMTDATILVVYEKHAYLRVGNESFYPSLSPTCSPMGSGNHTGCMHSANGSGPFPAYGIALIVILGFIAICGYLHCEKEHSRRGM